jgi:hypothetical protein
MPSRLDKFFGGKPGAAERARASMRRTYGPKKGETVFQATLFKRELKEKRRRGK